MWEHVHFFMRVFNRRVLYKEQYDIIWRGVTEREESRKKREKKYDIISEYIIIISTFSLNSHLYESPAH